MTTMLHNRRGFSIDNANMTERCAEPYRDLVWRHDVFCKRGLRHREWFGDLGSDFTAAPGTLNFASGEMKGRMMIATKRTGKRRALRITASGMPKITLVGISASVLDSSDFIFN